MNELYREHMDVPLSMDKAEQVLMTESESVRSELDLSSRYTKALALKIHALSFIERFNIKLAGAYDSEVGDFKVEEPTWDKLTDNFFWRIQTNTSSGGSPSLDSAIQTAHATITRYDLKNELEKIPPIDSGRYNKLRLKYGAKGAGLINLSERVTTINNRTDKLGLQVAVPDFTVVPVDIYNMWKDGKEIDGLIQPYYEWSSSLKYKQHWMDKDESPANYLVRSSAVYSEDGEKLTGAGIYKSLHVEGGSSFENFKKAVISVYESLHSEHAQAYRNENNIHHEEMGLVIQKFVSSTPDRNGHSNSTLPGIPELMEIVTTRSRNLINRSSLDFNLALDYDHHAGAFKNIHHFKPDNDLVESSDIIKVAQVTSIIEKVWNKQVQAEFVLDGNTMNIVQVRDLPNQIFKNVQRIEFPNQQVIYDGGAIGVGDMELDLLSSDDDNSEKRGAVVFASSNKWTTSYGKNSRLPKEGAVILIARSNSGHLQTLCVERGLVCIFPSSNQDLSKPTLGVDDFSEMHRVRIVSNGLEGRIYPVGEESAEKQ